ncbi:hypothetical protein [Deltalipothrixvirus pozzuoliense]|uniref:Uncharacterized protein ORF258 n=1 Tax=Acidianus filamentous virus 2 (isolate Italy/Pozzuoli) TaxID=654910 RepID=Y258_AFV2P|nr:hypothetical protein AFV2_gp37 [Acidianus filamentous virus 2]Q573D2.1 RecName: Full=Uncharacterized protein ORF258 [Acidianus filamentous virus 2 (isolate Pozzuoli)]CAH69424.1 hypothetical protein [Acidianus filamentous virus 2]
MRTEVKGKVVIVTEKGEMKEYDNQIQSSFISSLINYARIGGTISNYSYNIQLLNQNTLLGSYTGGLQYKQVSSSLQAIFTFVIPTVPPSVNTLQLYVSSSLGTFLVATLNNVSLPISSAIQIIWAISFSISSSDYFTPYLVFAFFAPPSSTIPFVNTPLPNVQSAITSIQNVGYLTSPPTYYATYNGQYVQVAPTFTNNTISIEYTIPNINTTSTFTNVTIVTTATSGYVNLLAQEQQITVQVGQVLSIEYNTTWSTS